MKPASQLQASGWALADILAATPGECLAGSPLSTTGRVSEWWDNSTVGDRREKRRLTLERRLCDLIGEKACRNEKREIKERRKITSQIKRRKTHKPNRKHYIHPFLVKISTNWSQAFVVIVLVKITLLQPQITALYGPGQCNSSL